MFHKTGNKSGKWNGGGRIIFLDKCSEIIMKPKAGMTSLYVIHRIRCVIFILDASVTADMYLAGRFNDRTHWAITR